jgi:hypothetical protein
MPLIFTYFSRDMDLTCQTLYGLKPCWNIPNWGYFGRIHTKWGNTCRKCTIMGHEVEFSKTKIMKYVSDPIRLPIKWKCVWVSLVIMHGPTPFFVYVFFPLSPSTDKKCRRNMPHAAPSRGHAVSREQTTCPTSLTYHPPMFLLCWTSSIALSTLSIVHAS